MESARTIITTVLQTISPTGDNTSYINAADEIISVEKELAKVCSMHWSWDFCGTCIAIEFMFSCICVIGSFSYYGCRSTRTQILLANLPTQPWGLVISPHSFPRLESVCYTWKKKKLYQMYFSFRLSMILLETPKSCSQLLGSLILDQMSPYKW